MIRAATTIVLLAFNTLFWGAAVTLLGLVKLITPTRELRRRVRLALSEMGDRWAAGNNRIFDSTLTTKWEISGTGELRPEDHYLIVSNHVSWTDIFVLFRAFHRRVAFPRFFMKQELMWFPIVGQACWAMDFPFMRRYTPEFLEKHPEKRGKDLETTKITCRRYRRIPLAILNFLEGTRYTKAKHAQQQSPYRHLLRPRVGGVAFVLASLAEQLDGFVDTTIAYPRAEVTLWDFLSNRIDRIVVDVRLLPIPDEFRTDAIAERGPARDHFRTWIETIWREKDTRLAPRA